MSDAVRNQFRQADLALDDAEGAKDAGLSDAVVVNRLYYACSHAAQAVLYERGYEPLDEDVDALLVEVNTFVEEMKQLVGK
jgi:uncharacterized protein (UPF0332 family)